MARTTISVPDDLKSEMDKAGREANWSAIAADAFRAELQRITARKLALKGDKMKAAIERLRSSKEIYAAAAAERGKSAGTAWARDTAEYGELKALAENWERSGSCVATDALGAPGVFLKLIGADADRRAVDDLWINLGMEPRDSDKYAAGWWNGFVEGALEVWGEVEGKL